MTFLEAAACYCCIFGTTYTFMAEGATKADDQRFAALVAMAVASLAMTAWRNNWL